MTTSEVSRNLSAVLASAERGETIAVTRSGKQVAMIVPAPRDNIAALDEVFRRWQGRTGIDDEFEANVAAIREMTVVNP
ncbi:MAG TPA: type II toxin-antitoxin system prevent-host-death family antitoxin [Pseudonocardia sp.]|jgi:prevent-host-death family protein|nr:type II toxin-antitoxin system prevent-host-death family antitoxin [Pseudonocardia sp.]